MKLTDYLVQFLVDRGVDRMFGVTGGAVVHIFDSADRNGQCQPVFHHHEQAAAFAAQAYARASSSLGVCVVTTGPGTTNAITGLAAAWLDSVPCLYLSGQTRFAHTSRGTSIRQVGVQHIEIVPMVSHMTKHAVLIESAASIRYELERAWHIATTGRPGPVWIDLPLDLQWADIDPSTLKGFAPDSEMPNSSAAVPSSDQISACVDLLAASKRPLVLAGYGVRRAGAEASFAELVTRFDLPFVTTWGAADILSSDHTRNLGRVGVAGQRAANLAIQNCDLLIAIGSHLSISVTGTMFKSFARAAKVVVVDIDPEELSNRMTPVHLPVVADAGAFISRVLDEAPSGALYGSEHWRSVCDSYRERYLSPPPPTKETISPYDFVSTLSRLSAHDDVVVVDGGGTNVYVAFQTFQIKGTQRLILSTGLCAMGSGLPEAIGAHYGSGGRRTFCLCGDGSLQLNIQELQTIRHHQLPIKLFVFSNGGYLSIRQTQKEFLEANYAGSCAEGGMSLPDYSAIAAAYGLPVVSVDDPKDIEGAIQRVLSQPGPVVCIARTSPVQEVIPRQGFDRKPDGMFVPRPLEDMAPFLDREEFAEAMQIQPWNVEKL